MHKIYYQERRDVFNGLNEIEELKTLSNSNQTHLDFFNREMVICGIMGSLPSLWTRQMAPFCSQQAPN